MNHYRSLGHTTWDCQLSYGLDSEIPEKSIIRRFEKISWQRFQRTGITKGVQSFRAPSHERSNTQPSVLRFLKQGKYNRLK